MYQIIKTYDILNCKVIESKIRRDKFQYKDILDQIKKEKKKKMKLMPSYVSILILIIIKSKYS